MPAEKSWTFIVLILATSLLAAVSVWIVVRPPAFDASLLNTLADYRTEWADMLFRLTTWAGSLYVLLPLVLLLCYALFLRGWRNDAWFMISGLVFTALVTQGLKHLIARPRPGLHDHLAGTSSLYAFPSSHASQVAAVALLVYLVIARRQPDWRWPAALLLSAVVIVVAASRLYLQVHYPLDVAAGLLTALAAVLGCRLAIYKA